MVRSAEELLLAYDFAPLPSRRSGLLPRLSKRRQQGPITRNNSRNNNNSKASSFR